MLRDVISGHLMPLHSHLMRVRLILMPKTHHLFKWLSVLKMHTQRRIFFKYNLLIIHSQLNTTHVFLWEQIMSFLETNRVMLSAIRVMLIPQVLARVDHTYIIERSTFTFSMAKPSTKPQWQSLFYPLALEVWCGILILVVVVPPIFYTVSERVL